MQHTSANLSRRSSPLSRDGRITVPGTSFMSSCNGSRAFVAAHNDARDYADGLYMTCRGAAERGLALILLLALCPLLLFLAALVRLTSPGPAFYTQVRLGRNGRHFHILKLRTMTHNCESVTGPLWSGPRDPRITHVGRFLRDTHLDELPQLVNVLRGEMSLIGPRPERPEIIHELELEVPEYRRRLLVLPGVTGLAQMHLSADVDLSSVQQKVKYDLYYVEHFSLALDLRILCATGFYFIAAATGLASKLLLRSHSVAIDPPSSRFASPITLTLGRSHNKLLAAGTHTASRAA